MAWGVVRGGGGLEKICCFSQFFHKDIKSCLLKKITSRPKKSKQKRTVTSTIENESTRSINTTTTITTTTTEAKKKGKQLVNKQPVKEEESTDHEYKFENTDRE